MDVKNITTNFVNLWSFHNEQNIEKVLHKMQELKMQGQYYQEVNMPDVSIVIKGLMNDIKILKNEKTLLLNELQLK